MARSLNKVMIIGYLGRDPNMRYTPNGKSVSNFSVACNRIWKDAEGNQKTDTEWFNVVAWGNLAEIAKTFLVKGSLVYIEGRLQSRSWQDNEGNQHHSTEIVARDLILLNSKENESNEQEEDEEYPF